ncbi:MAG: hypothetical protein JO171_16580 [Paludibacterium sp.]|uniref:helix-turn-helix domain-containing protein n=1 Tax=Paludibacterium sp. TaxID=1917523 RepID=UPI0025FAE1F1|nr:helix-turn-helix domain-containing protein [Paludibacterium sp.]MBV8048767.1 hypothetical protein [Paludibacterium sp.]
MPNPKKKNAGKAGAHVDLAGGLEATNQKVQQQSNTDAGVLNSKSTSTEIQLAKLLALLRQGPKTTIQLRQHGIMMPAARVFQLKNEHAYIITTELLPLYDAQGIHHRKCARYHLIEPADGPAQGSLDLVPA